MTFEEYCRIINNSIPVVTEQNFNLTMMNTVTSSMVSRRMMWNGSYRLMFRVKDMSVEEYKEFIRINKYLLKCIKLQRKEDEIQRDFE